MKRIGNFMIIVLIVSLLIVNFDDQEQKVIKYFPLDEATEFVNYSSNLTLLSETDVDSYKVQWDVQSNLEDSIYLRQDVSLLFVDGKLKGLLNQWKENANKLKQQTLLNGEDSSHYEAITFHHGEIHYPDDVIKSIQVMSHDELYVVDSPHSPLESFKEPADAFEKEWKKTLNHTKLQALNHYWNELMEHYELSSDDYLEIPLSDLWQYQQETFPTLTQEQTNQVIGQLWEGLYKNYITGIKSHQDQEYHAINTYMPLILIDKNGQFIYVLFRDGSGQNHRLIQRIPEFT
ncbi:hypothetical protein SAMN05421676_106113 [Salinibacillus kushneri]|uniref:Uncharacterized protein n=2 Tax=Salinibacillus kushneri TaxID=237682 RepID=A0A1I0FVP9_9BACI|nr:hypothetical protein SAMN05421676_106113 [Salinibacillus kushneri]